MPELMLKPNWPGTFRRTITVGKKSRRLEFAKNVPVEVTPAELKALGPDVGVSIFAIERDEKNRPRFVEEDSAEPEADPNENSLASVE